MSDNELAKHVMWIEPPDPPDELWLPSADPANDAYTAYSAALTAEDRAVARMMRRRRRPDSVPAGHDSANSASDADHTP